MTMLYSEWGWLCPCIDSKGEVFVFSRWDYVFYKDGEDTITMMRKSPTTEELYITSFIRHRKNKDSAVHWIYADDRAGVLSEFNEALHVVWSVLNGTRECDFEFSNFLQELRDKYGSVA